MSFIGWFRILDCNDVSVPPRPFGTGEGPVEQCFLSGFEQIFGKPYSDSNKFYTVALQSILTRILRNYPTYAPVFKKKTEPFVRLTWETRPPLDYIPRGRVYYNRFDQVVTQGTGYGIRKYRTEIRLRERW